MSLWVALLAPVLILLFFYLYLGLSSQASSRLFVQDAGDLGALAAAGCLDEGAMLAGDVVFDEAAAAAAAREYMGENLASAAVQTAVPTDGLFSNGLTLDEANHVASDTDGITVRFLYPGEGINPTTGGYVTKPTVLVASQVTVFHVFGGAVRHVTYSLASPR